MGGASPFWATCQSEKGRGNQPTMISHDIEILIEGGVEEMVHGLSLRLEGLPYIGILTPPTLVTHHLILYTFYY